MFFEVVQFVLIGFGAGMIGALLGLGGGIILVPALTLWCDIPVKSAVAASSCIVLANAHLIGLQRRRLSAVNIPVAVMLQLAALLFSLVGAYISVHINPMWLERLFAGAAILIAVLIVYMQKNGRAQPHDDHAHRHLSAPKGMRALLGVAGFSGILAGALGVGGGIFVVPALQYIAKLPARVATATSSYMMAVTGAGAALVYVTSAHLRPGMTVLCLAGAMAGGLLGNRLAHVARGRTTNWIFAAVLLYSGVRMWLK